MGLPGFEPGSREPKAVNFSGFVDWGGFQAWLLKTHEKSTASGILRYAKRYSFVLADPARASVVAGMTKDKRRNVMSALANLARYVGCYGYWRGIVKNSGLRWEKRGGVEVFLSIVNADLEGTMKWLKRAIRKLSDKYSAMLIFQVLTGLRPSEACMSATLIAELYERGELGKYFNRELSMLEHFRYPRFFLRRSKNAYISFVPEDVLRLILKTVKGEMKYGALLSAVRKKGWPCRMIQLRKLYATTLREKGVSREIIDLLQGRIGQSIFLRHYYKPYLNEVKTRVLKAVEPMTKELLSNL